MLGTILKQQGDGHRRDRGVSTGGQVRSHVGGSALESRAVARAVGAEAKRRPVNWREAERLNRKAAAAQASTFAVSVGKEKVKAGDYAGAIEKFREAIRLAADNPQAHYQLALALQHAGAAEEAKVHFADARRLLPGLRPPDHEKQ